MKTDQWNEDPREPRLDENDPVWQLLGESPRPEPDAWFTVRTLARCRLAEPQKRVWSGLWRWIMGTGLGFGLAVVLMVSHVSSDTMQTDKQKNAQEAFEIMATLQSSDTDSTSSTSWQDSSL